MLHNPINGKHSPRALLKQVGLLCDLHPCTSHDFCGDLPGSKVDIRRNDRKVIRVVKKRRYRGMQSRIEREGEKEGRKRLDGRGSTGGGSPPP